MTGESGQSLDLIDIPTLTRWMDEQGLEAGPIADAQQLTGGTQNLLMLFRRGPRRFVLRRPPRHPRGDGNQTMRREAQILGGLASTDVPHARLIAACADETVIGAAFYLMEPVEGFNAFLGLPPLHANDPAVRRAMAFSLIEALAKLGAVDHVAVGLGAIGKVDGFLERQVKRWRSQLDGYAEFANWPGPADIPGVDAVSAWLEDNRPKGFKPGILHGDYHMKNVMFRYDSPDIAAIVDWELATAGDPLVDMGWLLATWPGPNGEDLGGSIIVQPWSGFPTVPELLAHYSERSVRDLSAVTWYMVLACFKFGIILEGTNARAWAGKAPRDTADRLHRSAIGLFRRALSLIAA